jgi:hypothetical protein
VLPQREKIEGYEPIFTGVDLKNWTIRDMEKSTPWHVQNGMLIEHANGPINDLVSEKPHKDFILRFDYMAVGNGISSILLRGRYNVLDKLPASPAGVWQPVEIMLIGDNVTVTVNNQVFYNKRPLSEVATEAPDSPSAEKRPLILEAGHGPVAYRNMRIRELSQFDIRMLNGQQIYSYKPLKSQTLKTPKNTKAR